MLVDRLRCFAGFEDLSFQVLEGLASRTRCVRLPPGRSLVRPGRVLPGRWYLAEGRVRVRAGGRGSIVQAGSRRARDPVHPTFPGVETLTAATFLGVDADAFETIGEGSVAEVPTVLADDSWQPRFLASPLMQRLPPAAWQRVLRAMTLEAHAAGARIVTAGEAATCCYVLCSGAAEIRCSGDGAPVALLEPGNLFGEDALVTGRGRNASVVMTGPGATVSLSAEHFRRWLLDPVIRPLPSPAGCCVIDLDAPPPIPRPGHVYLEPGEVRRAARMLSAGETYAIVGGRLSERYLAAFLLAERDIDARPVCEGAAGGGA